MNGHILHELPIAVDYFCKSTESEIQLYFLTHMHADHTVGLTKYWNKKIYCSLTTGKLLQFKLGINKNFIIPLQELQSQVFSIRADKCWQRLCVTVIPAQHCPGSSMFLFETHTVKILYTGDCRPNKGIYEIGKTLWGPRNRAIDILYLDNTYCEPSCVFPPRDQAIEQIVKICKHHSDCTVFIGINWTGHEDLLVQVALEMEQRIGVTTKHLELLKLLEIKDVFTSEICSSNIRVLPSNKINPRQLLEINEHEERCIGILPTAKSCHTSPAEMQDCLMYTVPYSNHSSFAELWEFVKNINPRKIRPIVPGRKLSGMESYFRADMRQFSSLLNSEKIMSKEKCMQDELPFALAQAPAKNLKGCLKRKYLITANNTSKLKQRKKRPCGVVFDENE